MGFHSCLLLIASLGFTAILKNDYYYLDNGSIDHETMFNRVPQFRIFQIAVKEILFLFSYEGILESISFQCNHFVPIIFYA